MKRYNINIKNEAIKFRIEQGKTSIQISECLNVPRRTIVKWLKGYYLTHEQLVKINEEKLKKAVAKAREANAKDDLRIKARELRKEGNSVPKIAKILGVAKSSVSMWVRDIKLTENQKQRLKDNADKNRYYFKDKNVKLCKYHYKKRIEYQEIGRNKIRNGFSKEYLAGIMLYWTEGAKDRNSVCFSNSDFNMVKMFLNFLIDECGVSKDDVIFKIQAYLNEGLTIEEIEQHWLNVLDLHKSCLRKSYIKKDHGSKRKRLKYGVGVIKVSNTKLVQEIYGAIQEYAGFNNPEWLE